MVDDKSEIILDSALKKFDQYGFLKTTIEDIAKHAQISKATIYTHFKNKEEIFRDLVDREMKRAYIDIATAIDEKNDPIERIKQLFKGAFEYFENNKLIGKVIAMDKGLVLSLITDKNKELQEATIAVFSYLLQQGKENGVFREVEYEKVAYIMDSLLRSFLYLIYLGLNLHKTSDLLDPLIDLISHGLIAE